MKLKGNVYKTVVRPALLYITCMVYRPGQQREDNKHD